MKPQSLGWTRTPIVDQNGMPSEAFLKWLQGLEQKTGPALALNGNVVASAVVAGRTEGLGTTVQNLDATGKLKSTDNIAADGTGLPLTGGKRAVVALDANSRMSSSLYLNPVDAALIPTSATGMSNDGTSPSVSVPAQAFRASFGQVFYNSASFNPGSYGTWYAYVDDPTFAGGAMPIQFTTDGSLAKSGAKGRVYYGAITTLGGTPNTGGGNTGGTTSGGGGGNRGTNPK